jgi:hypothetical protein
LFSPPKLLTSTMPGTVRSAGPMYQSSSSSSCIGVSASFSTENWKISPSPLEMGPISGLPYCDGTASSASRIRSLTSWRAK